MGFVPDCRDVTDYSTVEYRHDRAHTGISAITIHLQNLNQFKCL